MKKNNLYSLLLLLVVLAAAAEACNKPCSIDSDCESDQTLADSTGGTGGGEWIYNKCINNKCAEARAISYDRLKGAGTGEAGGAEGNN
jgi:hypothetical protein